MRRAPFLLLAALLTPGCLGWLLGEEPPAPTAPSRDLAIALAPGRAWFNATFAEPRGPLTWTLARGVEAVDRGNATTADNRTFVAFTPLTVAGNGTWTVRFSERGLVVAERSFTLAGVAWAPRDDGLWSFRAERAGNRTLSLAGTLRAREDGWRLDAAGALREPTSTGSYDATLLHYAVEGREEAVVVARVLYDATFRNATGEPIGHLALERTLLRAGRATDAQGVARDGLLYRTWSRLTGTLRGSAGEAPFDTVTITEQWETRNGTPISWTRTTIENATGQSGAQSGYGRGDDPPTPLSLPLGTIPQPLRAGDAFVAKAGARVLGFRAAAEAGGVVAAAGAAEDARIGRTAAGDLVRYSETWTASGTTHRVLVGPPGSDFLRDDGPG